MTYLGHGINRVQAFKRDALREHGAVPDEMFIAVASADRGVDEASEVTLAVMDSDVFRPKVHIGHVCNESQI